MGARRRQIALIDQDGVLIDIKGYEPEWARLAAGAFAPQLGGNPATWASAQREAWQRATLRYIESLRGANPPDPAQGWDNLLAAWVIEGCRLQAVAPPSIPRAQAVGRRAMAHFFEHTLAIHAGSAAALARLAAGYELHMSSGNPAFIVEHVLRRISARDHIGIPFGSDLVGEYKEHFTEFYSAILHAIDARGDEVIVIDDDVRALDAAKALGAMTILVGSEGDCDLVADSFASAVEKLTGGTG